MDELLDLAAGEDRAARSASRQLLAWLSGTGAGVEVERLRAVLANQPAGEPRRPLPPPATSPL